MEQTASQHNPDIERKIEQVMDRHSSVVIAILFGSLSTDHSRPDSDLDLAVASTTLLDPQAKINLIEDLALEFGRPVDLVDLDRTHSPLLHQILTKGHVIFCKDRTRYAELLLRMQYEEADFMPYYRRILAYRRKAWIGI